MKKLTTLIFFLSAINCYSQITSVTTKEKEEPIEAQKYDSLESLNINNVLLHKGQTLYLKGTSYTKEDGYYCTFFTKIPDKSWNTDYTYKQDPEKKKGYSNYSEFIGKYYKVLSIDTDKSSSYETTYWLQLVGNDSIPFYYRMRFGLNGFVTLGYYEKMKQTFVGKEFYAKTILGCEKVDSKETVDLPFKTKFKCTDIAAKMGENEPPFAVLENEKYGKIKGEIIKGRTLHMFISISAYNQYVKKYGTKFGSSVAEGAVEIGMNKNMVRDSRGAPDHINTTKGSYGTHEQWVYDGRYVYFKNGIVTSTQF